MDQADLVDDAARRFTERYQQVAPALCVWALRHVSRTVQARIEVDDMLQETWLRAFRLRADFTGDDRAFRSWVFAIAKNLLLEVQRLARRVHRVQIGEGRTTHMLAFEELSGSVTALSRRLVRDEGLRRFHAHLEALPRGDQELISFCGLEGATVAVAARRLGISIEAAHKRWQRLRAQLRVDGMADDWLA